MVKSSQKGETEIKSSKPKGKRENENEKHTPTNESTMSDEFIFIVLIECILFNELDEVLLLLFKSYYKLFKQFWRR